MFNSNVISIFTRKLLYSDGDVVTEYEKCQRAKLAMYSPETRGQLGNNYEEKIDELKLFMLTDGEEGGYKHTRDGKPKFIFHGGCLSCTNQTKNGINFCIGCQYFTADWSLPNLSNDEDL